MPRQPLGQTVYVLRRETVLQAGEGGAGSQVGLLGQRRATDGEFEHRIAPQVVGVVAVDVAAGGLEYALAEQIGHGVLDVRRVPLVVNRAGQTGNQANLLVCSTQQQGTKIGRHRAPVEVGPDRKTGNGRKAKLTWDRITHGRSRLSFLRSVIGVTHIISIG